MLHASTRKLIDRLAEMTELGKLDWTEGESGQITYSTEGYSVSLTEGPNEVVITSKDGKELERASAEELATSQAEAGGSYAEIVAEMTKEAARIARGTETAISTLLAGMEDAPADAAEIEEAIEAEAAPLQEDPVDETMVAAEQTVETVTDTSAETELSSKDETVSEDAASEITETIEATDTGSEESAPEETEDSPDMEIAAPVDTIATAPELDAAPDAESETEVTEAVARLADEVNQRNDSSLDAAAASAVGAVALAAGLTEPDEEPSDPEPEPVTSDLEPEEVRDTTSEVALDGASETPAYVPFGLDQAAPVESAEAEPEQFVAEQATDTPDAADTTDSGPEQPETIVPLTFQTNSEPVAEPESVEDAPETEETAISDAFIATEIVSEEVIEETAPDTVTPFGFGDSSLEASNFAEAEPTEETISVDQLVETVATVESEAAVETTEAELPSEPTEADITPFAQAPIDTELEVATDSAIPGADTSTPVEVEPETPPQTQSYSLSGIGAGFGLGALSAKTEASGVPGPSAGADQSAEKILIDATDDVLPKPEGKINLPPHLSQTSSSASPTDAPTTEDAESGETDILKPRTRFNPWD
ncbi:MAG: hypothetical protein ACX94B_06725 [Henriciella sp.]